ncbi:molecular chaperone DnaK [bacterium]|nr:molecular chaperone DnaK [bacterium]
MNAGQRIIGIDLGTTNSVVSVVEGDEPVVIPNQEGANKTPSVVAFLDNNDCIVGEIARRQASTNPLRTITSIKRLMGVQFEDLDEWVQHFPYEIVNHDDRLLINVNGMGYAPEQISALILKKLKESAEAWLGEAVSQAVITVPAHFDDNQRNATMEAAKMAGLDVLRLINEPTAAALAYGIGKSVSSDEVIAVFDFGGGTFDITVLEISEKTFEVLTSSGDNHLGGDDLDNALVGLIVEEFQKRHGVDLMQDPVTLRRLKEVAEKAKIELSVASQTLIALPFITYKDGQPLHLERHLSREEFEDLIEPFINRTIRCCKRALDDAGLNKRDVKKVILVGGSTRIPLVQDLVEDFFGFAPFKGINPDEVVALGAATQAGVFNGNIEEVTLIDVAPHSLGIEVKDGKFSKIIDKNATIPIKAAKNFTTTEDNQTFVNVHILQGESDDAAENRSLGKFTLSDIPAMPRGRARVRVTFFMNADGVMEISAEELGSGVAKSLTILHSGLDDGEKRSRKKARQRRSGGTRSSTRSGSGDGGRRASNSGSSSAGTPINLGRSRNIDSSVVPLGSGAPAAAPDAGFAVLGDTNPGTAAPRPVSGLPAAAPAAPPVAPPPPVPAPDPVGESASYQQPQRYSRTSSPGFANPSPVALSDPGPTAHTPVTTKSSPANFPVSPPPSLPTPIREAHTVELVAPPTPLIPGGADGEDPPTQLMADMPTAVAFRRDTPEVKLPEIVTKGIAKAMEGADTPDAHALFAQSIAALDSPEWKDDKSWAAMHARTWLQLALGQLDEMRHSLSHLVETCAVEKSVELVALFTSALNRFSAVASIRRDRSRFRELAGDLEGACEDLEFANKMEAQPTDMERLEDLYRARCSNGSDPAAQFKLVKVFLKSNRVDEAIELLQDLQHHDAYETRATKILGLCHWQKNLHFLAWQKFKQLRQNEEIRDILFRLANDMESTGQLNNALTVYEHIAAENGDYRDVQAKIKKLRYRIKMHQDESEQSKASAVLTDPRFTILEEINRGSMGIIYKAQDKTLEEIVALKVLNDYLGADPSAVERFKREARAAKKLSHPYIVRIHDMFETGSKRFISMEYIEGTDLKRMLADRTSFSEDQLVYYFLQICDALSYAHRLNIIHRDIKPANIMITSQNSVKVTDFGIAKILKGEDSTKSGTAVIGTPLYMAPEQITGEGVDARSDIYSLGIMMYELVSGHPPFYLGNIEYHHIHTAPPPLPDKVSARLRDVIMKCVQKNPANRFQSVDEIFDALQVPRR